MSGINVLSLFDGMSCGRIALDRAGIEVNNYFAAEIDDSAIKVSRSNFGDVTHIGNVECIEYRNGTLYSEKGEFKVGNIDLILAGSPCQSFSNLGDGTGFDGKSGLYLHFLRILKEVRPKNWLLENVVMKPVWRDVITTHLGTNPIKICSSLVSAQTRRRYYWTNMSVTEFPVEKDITLREILCTNACKTLTLSGKGLNKLSRKRNRATNIDVKTKVPCLLASQSRKPTDAIVFYGKGVPPRYPTRSEMEKLQTVPLGYTNAVGYNDAARMLGNGWTVDIIAHILKSIELEDEDE